MWMALPRKMCDQHLLGEHVELHMFVGTLQRKRKINGFISNDLLEPLKIKERHSALAEEMKTRGFDHKSPLPKFNINYLPKEQQRHKINKANSRKILLKRCKNCK